MTIRITWTDPNGPLTQEEEVRVYRSTTPFDINTLPSVLATLPTNTLIYDDVTAAPDTSYYYAIGFVKDTRLRLAYTGLLFIFGAATLNSAATFGEGEVSAAAIGIQGILLNSTAIFFAGSLETAPIITGTAVFNSNAVFPAGAVSTSSFTPPVTLSLVNGGAEAGDASGWTAASGGVLWNSSNLAISPNPSTPYSGTRYFRAGDVANARMYQDVDISSYSGTVDSTGVVAEFSLRFITGELSADTLSMFLRALDATDTVLATVAQEDLSTLSRSAFDVGWYFEDLNMLLPSGTRKLRVEVHATRTNGTSNDVYIDDLALVLYDHTRRITPTYGSPISRGNRTSLITMSATNLVGYGTLSSMVDGAKANNYFFDGLDSDGTGWLTFDFGSGNSYVIDEFVWKQQNVTGHGVWRLEGSPNNSTWTQIGSDFTLNQGLVKPGGSNNTAYRYYRLRAMSGSRSASPYLYEINFRAK